MRTYSYGAKAPTENEKLVHDQLQLAHRYRNKLVEIEKRRREARRAAGDDKAKQDAADATSSEEVRQARAVCGVYWPSYLLVEDAAQRSRRTGREPRFLRWEGSGTLGVQTQGALSVPDLLSGQDTRVRLSGQGRHRTLHFRIGSEGRDPIWAVFPIVYHRDLPETAVIKWVRMICRRVGTKSVWATQFVLDGVEAKLPVPVEGAVAVDVGWRRFPDGVRVAVWVDDAGRSGELRLPQRLLDRWAKVQDLKSIRDKNYNAALAKLLAWRDGPDVPEWARAEMRFAHLWRNPGRLARLVLKGRSEDVGAVPAEFEVWRRQDKHLLEWECFQRDSVLRARRELYRLFALQMARYRRVTVEHLDLRDFAELPEGEEDPRTTAARPRRFVVALSQLLGCMADAVTRAGGEWLEAKPEWTTQTCAGCGVKEPFDAAGAVVHQCSRCGVEFDQDVNAARNLLRAAEQGTLVGGRSRAQRGVPTGESKAAVRRAKGLATRRTRRSKTMGQDGRVSSESQ